MPRFFLFAAAFIALSGCAYDPQIAAQYSKDGEGTAVVGPQLPSRKRPSTYDVQLERQREKQQEEEAIARGETPKTKSPATVQTAAMTVSEIPPEMAATMPEPSTLKDSEPATVPVAASSNTSSASTKKEGDDLTLPQPETPPAEAKKEEPKVQEQIVVDVAAPPVENPVPTPAPATASTPEPSAAESMTPPAASPAPTEATPVPAVTAAPAETPAAEPVKEPASKEETVAVIETKFGRIIVEFSPEAAPLTVENFRKLVTDGFYNGTTFHRIIPDFMIQGGDPNSKGTDRATHGKGGPDYTLQAEIKLPHKRGSVAMARLPNNVNPLKSSNGSQFYICIIDCPFLDDEYTVFGHVISGMDIVDRISTQPRDDRDNPLQPITMKVTLMPKSQAKR